jgi:phosphopentomutase
MRAFLIVLDSVGIGEAPDAAEYGDTGASTLAHTAAAVGGLDIPVLRDMGLGNIPALLPGDESIAGVAPMDSPTASFGAMRERSVGKCTTTGHWEMAGLYLTKGFHVFPPDFPSFPVELTGELECNTGRGILGNCSYSGTEIIARLGPEQIRTGKWIVYTSADSVMQIAAHEGVIPLEELYAACKTARKLCDPYHVARVIARPYVGTPGAFTRTQNRRDYSMPLPEPTILDHLKGAGIPVRTIGKLDDIFPGDAISEVVHVENNPDAQDAVRQATSEPETRLVFANLIDFDMLYGHRRNPRGYATALEQTDVFLSELLPCLLPDDVLIITADHGNDPTFRGTDHTREFVPLLAYRPAHPGECLGIRDGLYDVAQSLATFFGIDPMAQGVSFL